MQDKQTSGTNLTSRLQKDVQAFLNTVFFPFLLRDYFSSQPDKVVHTRHCKESFPNVPFI
jgi:hypothetical protein